MLGAIVVFILEKQLFRSAVAALVGAALSWVGLLHADQVGWGAAPGVALGYLLLAVTLAGIGQLQRRVPEPDVAPNDVPATDAFATTEA